MNKLKKHYVTVYCFDLTLLEQLVLVISKLLQILSLQPRISKQFFLTVGQNSFVNKIPFLILKRFVLLYYLRYVCKLRVNAFTLYCQGNKIVLVLWMVQKKIITVGMRFHGGFKMRIWHCSVLLSIHSSFQK